MYRQYVQSGIAPGANTVTTSAIAANTIQPWQLSSSLLNPTVNSFTGDGTTTSFTLSLPPASANTVVVTVNGITQSPVTNYSTNNTSLVFTSAPSNASVIRAVQQAMIGTSIVPIDGSVTTSKLGSNLTLSGNTSFSGAISGTSATLSSTLGVTGVTTLTAQPILSSLTASSAVATDASKGLVSVTNTGSGNNVLAASPTLTGTVAAASLSLSSLTSGRVTYANTSGLLTDSANLTYGTGLTVNGISQAYQTGLYTVDGALSNYSVNNGVYLNGNTTGWSQLSGDGTRATFVRVWGSGASPANFIVFNAAGSERMRIDSAGNVSIGGFVPSAWDTALGSRAIQFTGGSVFNYRDTNFILTQNAYFDGAFKYYASSIAAGYYDMGSGTHKWFNAPSGTAGNAITFTQAMTLDTSGNLLVGTTTALSRLTTSRSAGAAGAVNGQIAMTHDTATTAYYISTIRADATNEPAGLTFKENATERMRIDASGNVGIGTSTPANKLDVYTNSAATYAARIFNNNAYGGLFLQTSSVSSSIYNLACYNSASYLFVVRDDGNVGIGTSSPSGKLDVNGDVKVSPNTAGKNTFLLTTNASNDGRLLIKSDTTDKVDIQANGTSYFEGGTVRFISTVSVGNATPSSSGAGITFPVTQSASSDANTLDDYEEGTWTPTVSFSGTASVGATYSTRLGTYTKIGRTVYFSCRITLTNKGSSTGSSQITGLPFTVFNNGGSYGSASLGYSDATTGWNVTFQAVLDTNQTYIILRYNNGTNTVDLTDANWTNTTDCIWTGTYQTST